MGHALVRAAPRVPERSCVTGAVASPAALPLGRDAGELAGSAPAVVIVTATCRRALREATSRSTSRSPRRPRANLAACARAGKPLAGRHHRACGRGSDGADRRSRLRDPVAGRAQHQPRRHAAGGAGAACGARTLPLTSTSRSSRRTTAEEGRALGHGARARRGRRRARHGAAGPRCRRARRAHAGPRRDGGIGFAVVRAGDIVGEHQVRLRGTGEQLCLTHRATDRAIFARGALTRRAWLASQPPARYSMRDMLFVKNRQLAWYSRADLEVCQALGRRDFSMDTSGSARKISPNPYGLVHARREDVPTRTPPALCICSSARERIRHSFLRCWRWRTVRSSAASPSEPKATPLAKSFSIPRLTGYQEILTDPSYARQIVTLTYPHIGNTGTTPEDLESAQIYAAGLVIRDLPLLASSWRANESLRRFPRARQGGRDRRHRHPKADAHPAREGRAGRLHHDRRAGRCRRPR